MTVKMWTIERIRDLSDQDQRTLYERSLNRSDGTYIVEMMDNHGLAPRPKLMSFTDPIYRKMVQIAKSAQGKAAMEDAASKGWPALYGFDTLLQSQLGADYSDLRCPGTIMSAGSLVAEIMPKLGYINAGKATCPEGCIAREGIVWVKD